MDNYEFVINSKGTRIKKCCASCAFKKTAGADDSTRTCTYGNRKTKTDKSFVCLNLAISETIDNVKTNMYIQEHKEP